MFYTNYPNYTNYSYLNLFILDNSNYIICDKKGIYLGHDIFNNIHLNNYDILSKMFAHGGIKITDDILAITSNQVLSKGENKLIFFSSRNLKFLSIIESKNYSFLLSENNCALMKISNPGNCKLLLIACKKYSKGDRNGILLLKLQLHNDDIKIFQTFYDTKNFEVYCFCPIYETETKYIFIINQKTKKNNDYFYVGGFDPDKRKGLIKLYKVIYDDEIEKIEIEYIQDFIVGKENKNQEDFTEHNNLVYSGKIDNPSNIEKYDEKIIYENIKEKKEKYKTFDAYNEKFVKTNNEKKEKTNNEIIFRTNFEEKYNIYKEKFVKPNNEKKEKINNEKFVKTNFEEKYNIYNEKFVKSNNEKKEKINNEKFVKTNDDEKEKTNNKTKSSECFKGFKGPISSIIQSSKGGILVTCYDGNVYLFSEPKVNSLHSINYNLFFKKFSY